MTPTTSLVIDTDTASDDAVALLLALNSPDHEVRAITTVAGNVPLEYATRNALITLDVARASDIPVYAGTAKPILRDHESAQHVHGHDGMSGCELPDPTRAPHAGHAVLRLIEIAATEPARHTLITLGPLTNIAAALLIDPLLLTKFRHTYMMAGAADGRGNVSPAGEFNTWADPEAAAIVFAAEGPKTMIGWDVSRTYAVIREDEDRRMRELGPLGAFASDINRAVLDFATEISGSPGYDFPDPVAVAVALDESLITASEERHVYVSTAPETRGMTVTDHRHPKRPATVRVVTAVSEGGFKQRLFEALTEEPGR